MKLTEMLAIVEEMVILEKDLPAIKVRLEEAHRVYNKASIGAERAKTLHAFQAVQEEQTSAFNKHRELMERLPPRATCPDADIVLSVAQSNVRVKNMEASLVTLEAELATELAKPNPNAWKRSVARESAIIVDIRKQIEVCQELIPAFKKSNASIHNLWTKMVALEAFDEELALFREGKGPVPVAVQARMAAERREFEKGCIPYEPPADLGAVFQAMRSR